MFKRFVLGAAMAAATASAANAAVMIDGVRDLAYGASTATVAYDPAAPLGDFSGGPANHNVGYDIFLHGADGFVYGFFQADGDTHGLNFSNVYFNIDGVGGSDLGFEIGNHKAFIPGVPGLVAAPDISYAIGANSFEFAIPVAYFTTAFPGLSYGATLPHVGDNVQLRLSQTFGYSVAGGSSFGDDRLGFAKLTSAAPEPAAWSMMLVGFFGLGSMVRRRRAAVA